MIDGEKQQQENQNVEEVFKQDDEDEADDAACDVATHLLMKSCVTQRIGTGSARCPIDQ